VVVDGTSARYVGAVMFGLVEFRVLAAGVIGGELELLVETTAAAATCPSCAGPASPHAGREPGRGMFIRVLPKTEAHA
jgi:hypothetical protein